MKPSGTPSPAATAMMKQFASLIGSSTNAHTNINNSRPLLYYYSSLF